MTITLMTHSTIAPANFDPASVTITRKRFSTTQGETLVEYKAERIGQYGDTPVMQPNGEYHQRPAEYWMGVAMREAVSRGMVQ